MNWFDMLKEHRGVDIRAEPPSDYDIKGGKWIKTYEHYMWRYSNGIRPSDPNDPGLGKYTTNSKQLAQRVAEGWNMNNRDRVPFTVKGQKTYGATGERRTDTHYVVSRKVKKLDD
tara:strand:+ start:604 stop:948 length:345 start_codon:yes stop_codon:yes gene_type:complete